MFDKMYWRCIFVILIFTALYSNEDETNQSEFNSYIPSTADDYVNLATGDFSYKIPLLEVPSTSGKSFPVTLFYQSGIGLEQEASWTGLGWNINVGSIVRNASGMMDDFDGVIESRASQDMFGPLTLGFQSPTATYRTHQKKGEGEKKESENEKIAEKGRPITGGPTMFSISNPKGNTLGGMRPYYSSSSPFPGLSSALRANSVDFQKQRIPITFLNLFGISFSTMLQFPLSQTDFHARGLLQADNYNNVRKITTCDYSDHVDINITDGLNAFPYYNYYCGLAFMVPTHDYYTVNCDGISGAFTSYKTGRQEGIPWQGLAHHSSFGDLNGYSGYALSNDYSNDVTKTIEEKFRFMYVGDKANKFIQFNTSSVTPETDLERAKKVIPLFDTNNKIVGFRVIDEQGNEYKFGRGTFLSQTISRSSSDGGDFSTEQSNPNCYTSWIIESISGPDYIDKGAPGFDTDDMGFWVVFKYETTTDMFKTRAPFEGDATPPSFVEMKDPQSTFTKVVSTAVKNVQYLRNIITDNTVAVFAIGKRDDGYENDGSGVKGTDALYRLNSISMYDRNAFQVPMGANNCWDDSEASEQPYGKINFVYDYTLCPGTPNSIAAPDQGKLTLRKVQINGYNNTEVPPYEFNYGFNPAYEKFDYDRWGFYKANGEQFEHIGCNEQDASAWSMTEMVFPTGATLKIDYEADRYDYVHDVPLVGVNDALTEAGPENMIKGKGRFFSQDGRFAPPAGNRVYEIRSFTPGEPVRGDTEDPPMDASKCIGSGTYQTGYYFLKRNISSGEKTFAECKITKDEIPEDFKLSQIVVDAYCGPSGGSLAADPKLDISMVGYKNGRAVHLKSTGDFTLGTFQWVRNESNDLRHYPIFDYYEIKVKMWLEGINAPPYDEYQRDMRVFLIDDINPSDKPITKYGGGTRVKQLSYFDGVRGRSIVKNYFYDSNEDGTGNNTGVASLEPAPYSHAMNDDRKVMPFGLASFIPGEVVYYGKVTVQTNNAGKTVHEYYTPVDKPITATATMAGPSASFDYEVTNESSYWGMLKGFDKKNANGKTIYKEEYVYTNNYGQSFEEIATNQINDAFNFGACPAQYESLTEDSRKFKTKIWNYYPTQQEKAVYDHGVEQREIYQYNTDNGLPDVTTIQDAAGNTLKREEAIYAFEVYDEMGHKNYLDPAEKYRKNLLTLPLTARVFDNVGLNYSFEVSPFKAYNPVTGANPLWYDNLTDYVYRQWYTTGSYKWKSDDPLATVPAFDYTLGSIDATQWQLVDSISRYSAKGFPQETAKPLSSGYLYTTTIQGHDGAFLTGTVTNSTFEECGVFTGDYQCPQTPASWWDKENGWEKGGTNPPTLDSDSIHFGQKSIKVEKDFAAGRNFRVYPGKAYTMTAWVKVTNGTGHIRMDGDFRKLTNTSATWPLDCQTDLSPYSPSLPNIEEATPLSKDSCDGSWRLMTMEIPADLTRALDPDETWYCRAWVGEDPASTAPTFTAYVDDIRFAPSNAMVTSTYYDLKLKKPILTVDANNNPGQKITYDDLGRPVLWQKVDRTKGLGDADYALPVQRKEYRFMLDGLVLQKPQKGDIYTTEGSMEIAWLNYKGRVVDVYYSDNTGKNWTFLQQVAPVAGQREYSITWNNIPAALDTGSLFRIKIVDPGEPAVLDISGPFSIKKAFIYNPTAESVFQHGSAEEICYYMYGGAGINVTIAVNGVNLITTPNTGSWVWEIPPDFNNGQPIENAIITVQGSNGYIAVSDSFKIKRYNFIRRFVYKLLGIND